MNVHAHSHSFHVCAGSRTDPTRTVVIRKRYERELVKRYRAIQMAVLKDVGQRDALVVNIPSELPRFDFPTKKSKVEAFLKWLRAAQDKEVLQVFPGTPLSTAARSSWQNLYIKSAYQKGIAMAGGQLRKGGADVSDRYIDAAFYRPIHADAVGLLYTRAFTELDGITRAVDQKLSRVLAQGMVDGLGPMKLARNIVDEIDSIGITRARMLARTETIRAHADATLNLYDEADADGVELMSEFTTADDNRVCPQCEELAGKQYTVDEARGIIPVHPNCRCAWLPVVSTDNALKLL